MRFEAPASKRGLQAVLLLMAAVAILAGGSTVIGGADLVIDGGEVSPSVDSELRFYAAWYVVAGVVLLRAVPQVESQTAIIRIIGGGLFLAACGRVIGIASVGVPHAYFVTLMVIEFVIPLVIIPWQAAVSRLHSEEMRE